MLPWLLHTHDTAVIQQSEMDWQWQICFQHQGQHSKATQVHTISDHNHYESIYGGRLN